MSKQRSVSKQSDDRTEEGLVGRLPRAGDDDTEGHRFMPKGVPTDGGGESRGVVAKAIPKVSDDDTEGHRFMPKGVPTDEGGESRGVVAKAISKVSDDDTEGHRFMPKGVPTDDGSEGQGGRRSIPTVGEDDDTESHSMLSNPLLGRELARVKDQDIQRHLKQHETTNEGRRLHRRESR